MAADKPILSKRAFPDIDMDSIDYEKDALNVMERVIQQGKSTDFDELLRFYGRERIRK